jgi:hypothetical protein
MMQLLLKLRSSSFRQFWPSLLGPLGFLFPKIIEVLAFQSFDFEVPDEGYSNLSTLRYLMKVIPIFRLCQSVPDEGYFSLSTLSVPDEGYSNLSTLSVPDEGYSNLSTLSVPDEGYSNLSTLRYLMKVIPIFRL